MKLTKLFNMKRRWRDTKEKQLGTIESGGMGNSCEKPSASSMPMNSFRWKWTMKQRNKGDASSLTLEETSSSSNASSMEDAPWRKENILLQGAPRETDWWEDVVCENDSGADEEVEKDTTDEEKTTKVFRNRGYSTWIQTREAWRRPDDELQYISVCPPTPISVKRDLVKCLKERRQFELSRSIPLKDMIHAYCEVWESGDTS